MKDNRYLIIGIVFFIAIMSLLSTDFYVPAMPDMVSRLETTPYWIKLSVTVYMLGLAFSPLVFGPLSDRYGRRPIILGCTALGVLGSFLCWLSPFVDILVVGRLIQGIGLGAVLSLSRTLGSDLLEKQEFAKVASILSLCASAGPGIAPVIGGYLHLQFGWRSIFMFLTVLFSLGLVVIIRKVPETNKQCDPRALHLKNLVNNYSEIVTDKIFMSLSLLAGLTVSTMLLFGVLSTFILQKIYHLSSIHYAWIMMLVTTASIMSRVANIILLKTKTPEQCVEVGLYAMLFGGAVAVLMSLLKAHYVMSIVLPAMIIIFGAGLVPSNSSALALMAFRHKAGSAGAIYGSVTMLSVFLISFVGSVLPATPLILNFLLLGISVFCFVLMKISTKPALNVATA